MAGKRAKSYTNGSNNLDNIFTLVKRKRYENSNNSLLYWCRDCSHLCFLLCVSISHVDEKEPGYL